MKEYSPKIQVSGKSSEVGGAVVWPGSVPFSVVRVVPEVVDLGKGGGAVGERVEDELLVEVEVVEDVVVDCDAVDDGDELEEEVDVVVDEDV